MESYIKYKRICIKIKEEKIQDAFDQLVLEGWDIIHYEEKVLSQEPYTSYELLITIVVGKRQNRIL